MSCDNVITVQDLETDKKHSTFYREVITGKAGGTGDDIDSATNAVTGQTQSTLPKVLSNVGFSPAGFDFTTGGTLTERDKAIFYQYDGNWYSWGGTLPKVVPPASSPASTGGIADSAWNVSTSAFMYRDWEGFTAELLAQAGIVDDGLPDEIGNSQRVEAMRKFLVPRVDVLPPVLGRDSRFQITDSKVALRYGISDALPLDDTQNHYRGLQSSKDAWGDVNNLGVGSFAAGRNNAAFAYLSTAYGHDCITYGVASFSGGAGTATGNPDVPGDGASYGYCSFGYGKNSLAKGRVSSSVGELCLSDSDNSGTSGLRAKAGPCVAGMPNPIGAGPVISAGIGAQAHGVDVEAYGDSAAAYGRFIKCYNGAMVFGYGINQGSPIVNSIPGAVGISANSDVMGIQVTPAPGTNGGFVRVGQNTAYPNERYESMLKNTDKIAYRLEEGEVGATFSLQRTVGGVISDVVSITFNNAGIGSLLINGQQVVSNRAAAISDAQTDANKIQAILDTLRYHGLIAS